jgi:hypothetical protein
VLALIRAHAILHQASRSRAADGKVVATLEDYEIVRELVAGLVSEGVEATVPATVRETVQAVAELDPDEAGVSVTALARALKLDKASASRRWTNARARGYLKNLESVRGKPARIVLAEPLPDDVQVLPTVKVLRDEFDLDGLDGLDDLDDLDDVLEAEQARLEAEADADLYLFDDVDEP